MSLSEIRAVIFDMDGLLVDSERLARQSLVETASAFEVPGDCNLFAEMIGIPEDSSRVLLRGRYGANFPAERFLEQASIHCKAQVASGRLQLKAGVSALLDRIERSGLEASVATSSSRLKAEHTLRSVGVLGRFRWLVTRDDVRRGKPFPDLFLRAADEMGVAAHNCLVLEDSYNGVRAAQAAKMSVIMVPDLLPARPEDRMICHMVLPDLFAVGNVLASAGVLVPQ